MGRGDKLGEPPVRPCESAPVRRSLSHLGESNQLIFSFSSGESETTPLSLRWKAHIDGHPTACPHTQPHIRSTWTYTQGKPPPSVGRGRDGKAETHLRTAQLFQVCEACDFTGVGQSGNSARRVYHRPPCVHRADPCCSSFSKLLEYCAGDIG